MIRKNNEDSIFVSNEKIGRLPNLYIVSDGMGGHKAGEIASSKAITFFCDYIKRNDAADDILDHLISAVKYTNKEVFKASLDNPEYFGMGATFSACVMDNNKLYAVHIGDSRIYIFNGSLTQVTIDHTYVGEMVRSGILTEEEARRHPNKNIITKALGVEENVSADGIIRELKDSDMVLICSDGLSNMLTPDAITDILSSNQGLEKSVEGLIKSANKNGGEDNISVLIIEKEGSSV